MSTKIEWCTETWNPIVGCTKVSPGCEHCYAERMAKRLKAMSEKFDGTGSDIFHRSATGKYADVIGSNGKWNGKTSVDLDAVEKIKQWKKPRMIFVCSMGDIFHESISDTKLYALFNIMRLFKEHTFLLLTKRPVRMKQFYRDHIAKLSGGNLIPNVWLGVTAENQIRANERIPILLQIPAAKRFVSVEPMLTAIDFYDIQMGNEFYNTLKGFGDISGSNGHFGGPKLDWVICGGESGPGARPLHPDWVRSLRDQCEIAGTPFFFKQWGGVNKKAAGSELDGKHYKQYPK